MQMQMFIFYHVFLHILFKINFFVINNTSQQPNFIYQVKHFFLLAIFLLKLWTSCMPATTQNLTICSLTCWRLLEDLYPPLKVCLGFFGRQSMKIIIFQILCFLWEVINKR